jgi:hypothetical protein
MLPLAVYVVQGFGCCTENARGNLAEHRRSRLSTHRPAWMRLVCLHPARVVVSRTLLDWELPPCIASTCPVTRELVSNAMLHAQVDIHRARGPVVTGRITAGAQRSAGRAAGRSGPGAERRHGGCRLRTVISSLLSSLTGEARVQACVDAAAEADFLEAGGR